MEVLIITPSEISSVSGGQAVDIVTTDGRPFNVRCVCRYRHFYGEHSNPGQFPVLSLSPGQLNAVGTGSDVHADAFSRYGDLLPVLVRLGGE